MAIPLLAGAAGLGKAALTGLGGMSTFSKILMALMGGQFLQSTMESKGRQDISKAQIGLQKRQIESQGDMGRREEARTDKLMRQLLGEKEKNLLREERTGLKQDLMRGEERQSQMAMAMLMSLMSAQDDEAEIMSGPRPSTASMLSLMR